ncbi:MULTISPECIES: hypothetical protein [Flavobacterium]|uniref:hypothetical protein n=1 Tax=Flavobacterium TaxID=237 RepID=UPI002115155E|nr:MULTISPECIES: hypothetical protein [Flavobacterium]UUF14588.1 hypothetical protein NLJ00_00440 [Flavobacterium panici]
MLNNFLLKFRIRNINIETQNNKDMETNNLGSKKINGVQKDIDETKGKNISHDGKADDANLKKEVVADKDGNKEVVDRARNENEDIQKAKDDVNPNNPNANRGVSSDEEAKKTVENKDRNSDVEPNRYPNSHPDNHEDRGNMKLDEDK